MENNNSGKQTQLNNYKIPGMRGPRNRGGEVEKPQDAKKTIGRLCRYFSKELHTMIVLLASVFVMVICSVIAP